MSIIKAMFGPNANEIVELLRIKAGVKAIQDAIWDPTLYFRYLRSRYNVCVLQQRWQTVDGRWEWRDVPVEDAP
jgi:hypothetical protein